MSDKEKTEEEVINECVDYACKQSEGTFYTNNSFCVFNENSKEIQEKCLDLFTASTLDKYAECYQDKYEEQRGKRAEVIYFRNLLIQNHPRFRLQEVTVVYQDCKFIFSQVPDSRRCELFAARLENCFIISEYKGGCLIECPDIKGCVIKGNATIGEQAALYRIKNCWLEGKTIFARGVELINSSFTCIEIAQGCSKAYIRECDISEFIARIQPKELIVSDTKFGRLLAEGIEFNKFAFSNVEFSAVPEINGGTEFSRNNVNIRNCTFKDLSSEEALGTFRGLKKKCEQAGYEAGVILFHGLELETYYNCYLRKACPKHDWAEKVFSFLHKHVSDYGRNTLSPLLYVVIILLVVAISQHFIGGEWLGSNFGGYVQSLKCSISKSLGPLFFALPETIKKSCDTFNSPWFQAVHFLQLVITSVIWFLWIMMIRRRFKI